MHPMTDLIPHRGSMLLIDRLLSSSKDMARVEAVVRRDCVLSTEEGLPGWIGVELMAQAVAAWAGVRRIESNEAVRLGFLLGTRRYDCTTDVFPVGARLEVEVREELSGENGLGVFSCTIEHEGVKVAWANLNVFQPPDVAQYLAGGVHE
jgi:predicted hotdog family 3-hydroxylacyl-ACP dehydratase